MASANNATLINFSEGRGRSGNGSNNRNSGPSSTSRQQTNIGQSGNNRGGYNSNNANTISNSSRYSRLSGNNQTNNQRGLNNQGINSDPSSTSRQQNLYDGRLGRARAARNRGRRSTNATSSRPNNRGGNNRSRQLEADEMLNQATRLANEFTSKLAELRANPLIKSQLEFAKRTREAETNRIQAYQVVGMYQRYRRLAQKVSTKFEDALENDQEKLLSDFTGGVSSSGEVQQNPILERYNVPKISDEDFKRVFDIILAYYFTEKKEHVLKRFKRFVGRGFKLVPLFREGKLQVGARLRISAEAIRKAQLGTDVRSMLQSMLNRARRHPKTATALALPIILPIGAVAALGAVAGVAGYGGFRVTVAVKAAHNRRKAKRAGGRMVNQNLLQSNNTSRYRGGNNNRERTPLLNRGGNPQSRASNSSGGRPRTLVNRARTVGGRVASGVARATGRLGGLFRTRRARTNNRIESTSLLRNTSSNNRGGNISQSGSRPNNTTSQQNNRYAERMARARARQGIRSTNATPSRPNNRGQSNSNNNRESTPLINSILDV